LGRVRTTFIKRTAAELIRRYPDRFGENFEDNKRVVYEILPHLSKPIKNKVAGYISSLLQRKREGELDAAGSRQGSM